MSLSLDKKRLTISISQVAPLIGLDNYNNFPRIVCEIWRRYNPEEFREYELKMKSTGKKLVNSSEMNDIWEIDTSLGTNITQQVKELNSNKEKSSQGMVKMQQQINTYINKQENLTTEQKDELSKKVCSITNKMHGVNNEDIILKEFCRLSEKSLQETQGWVEIPLFPTSGEISTDEIFNCDNIEWLVIGKYDGLTGENEVVEAKMRQKALFKKMRDYENVQLQLYLHAVQASQGYLIEAFTNKKGEMQIYTHEVAYNAEYVNEVILERLKSFTSFFKKFMENKEYKEELLIGDTKRHIYQIYEKDYLGIEPMDF